MLYMNVATLGDTLEQLDQAFQDHLEWHANLLRVVICKLPCDPNDLKPEAHRLCRFGQWYYEYAAVELRGQRGYQAIGAQHQRVHEVATTILRDIEKSKAVERHAFNELMVGSMLMRRHLDQMRRMLLLALRSRDTLTGAYCRTEVLPELRRRRESVKLQSGSCVVCLMDVDGLQEVNKTHGHLIGDALLAESVRLLREQLRDDDKVFRYGGDEFLVSLPGADLAVGQAVVGRVRDAFARRQLFVGSPSFALPLTASFGLALLDPDVRVEDSIDRAAQALLLAKTVGGDRAICWDSSVTTGTRWTRLQVHEGVSEVRVDADEQGDSGHAGGDVK
jgi:diguanylate cyclase